MSWRNLLRRFVLLGGAGSCLTGFGVLAQEQSFLAGGPAVSFTAEQATRGEAVYDGNCGNCHGVKLDDGHTPMSPDARLQLAHESLSFFNKYLKAHSQ